MDTSNSEFYHFGLLPEFCIHTLEEDQYSAMYTPREKCHCGCSDWIESTVLMLEDIPPRAVHRCKDCNSIRVADHIRIQ